MERNVSNKNLTILNSQTFNGQEIRIYGTPEEPIFVAQDVAKWIERDITSVHQMLQSVDKDEKLLGTMYRAGQNHQVWCLTEYGLYEVLMLSRKPIAKQFKQKVKEILKSIRITGSYQAQKEDTAELRSCIKDLQTICNSQNNLIQTLLNRGDSFTPDTSKSVHHEEMSTLLPECTESFIVEEYSGEIIRKCRETANMTQTGICKALNMSRSGLIKIETNKHRPLAPAFINLLKAMNYVVIIQKTNN